MAGEVVRVEYTKYDGGAHRGYEALRLGEDAHGVWLGVPDPRNAHNDGYKYDDPYVLLVPRDSWWTALFNAPPRRTEVYCDIATPATWVDPHRVRFVDLDLDVRRRREHSAVELVDEDEFEVNRVRFGYPDDVVSNAWAAAHWLVKALSGDTEPFAGGYRAWLDQVR
jgi:protein associated with RNAse G/E